MPALAVTQDLAYVDISHKALLQQSANNCDKKTDSSLLAADQSYEGFLRPSNCGGLQALLALCWSVAGIMARLDRRSRRD